jgi:hypothetical protein
MGGLVKSYVNVVRANFDGGVFAALLACVAGPLFTYHQFDIHQIATAKEVREAYGQCSDIASHLAHRSTPLTNKQIKDFLADCRDRDVSSKALDLQRAALQRVVAK